MKKHKHSSVPIVGGTSLLMIFTVLCLIVFTLLTLSTVNASRNLSNVSADSVLAYYEADSQAEKIFAQLRAGEKPEIVTVEENVYSFSCHISETQVLLVEVYLEDGEWKIMRWQSESTNR